MLSHRKKFREINSLVTSLVNRWFHAIFHEIVSQKDFRNMFSSSNHSFSGRLFADILSGGDFKYYFQFVIGNKAILVEDESIL